MLASLITVLAAITSVPQEHSTHQHQAPRLGQIDFESTCNIVAKPLIERGLGWLHSFEYEEAERDFTAAALSDPHCGIAHWGVAQSLYHPLWAPPSPAEIAKGQAALKKAKYAGAGSTRERDFIKSIASFYGEPRRDHRSRVMAYAAAMEQLHRRYPKDREAAVFYALALIAAGTIDDDPAYGRELAAAAILNGVFKDAPDHPGVAHYLIHGYDYPALAHLALPAARRYAKIAPASAHAQHMPSHIFVRLGHWDEAITSNKAAEAAALAYAASRSMPGAWDERLHAMDYLMYSYLQAGNDAAARNVLHDLHGLTQVDPSNFKVAYAVTAIPARYALERQHWAEAADLALPSQAQQLVAWSKFRWAEAHIHLARAIGAARLGKAAAAREEVAKLVKIERELATAPGEYDWKRQVSVQRQIAQAWTLHAEGRADDAVRMMQAAAAMDDKMEKHPVTPGSVAPAREQLGELLLDLNRPAEAHVAFEAALKLTPNRRVALAGLARATDAAH